MGFAALASIVRDGHREWGLARCDSLWTLADSPPDSVEAGVGAVTCLGTCEPRYREQVWTALRTGTARDVVDEFGAGTWKWPERQIAVVDRYGDVDAYTGEESNPWAGDLCDGSFVAIGNSLRGQDDLEAMREAWSRRITANPLSHQLVAVLLAARTAEDRRLSPRMMHARVVTVSDPPESVRTDIRVLKDDEDSLDRLAAAVLAGD